MRQQLSRQLLIAFLAIAMIAGETAHAVGPVAAAPAPAPVASAPQYKEKILAPGTSHDGISATEAYANSAASTFASVQFKFPMLLCVYQYSSVTDSDQGLDLRGTQTPEFAYAIRDIRDGFARSADGGPLRMLHIMTGSAEGEYVIDNTPYRVRFEAALRQGIVDGRTHELTIHTYLEKRDNSGAYNLVGKHVSRDFATEDSSGKFAKAVYARATNHEMDVFREGVVHKKIDTQKVKDAIADGRVGRGAVFNAGPVCGLMDVETAKSVTSHSAEFNSLMSGLVASYRSHLGSSASNGGSSSSTSSSAPEPVVSTQDQAPQEQQQPVADPAQQTPPNQDPAQAQALAQAESQARAAYGGTANDQAQAQQQALDQQRAQLQQEQQQLQQQQLAVLQEQAIQQQQQQMAQQQSQSQQGGGQAPAAAPPSGSGLSF